MNLQVGDKVRFSGYGGEVRLMDCRETGEVIRINRSGFPVIVIRDHSHESRDVVLTDRYGCARKV